VSLDAHPHIREYFAAQVRSPGFSRSGPHEPPEGGTTSDAWRAAHRRLYEHLCATTKEGDRPTLEDLQPLYQAVAHGCQAGLQQEAREGFAASQADLDEAWEIAERGPMKLFMADIHLYRARLFFREATYPWESPQADLAAARKLIESCGYGRRKEELEVAEKAILGR
jgi:hypothetical protein